MVQPFRRHLGALVMAKLRSRKTLDASLEALSAGSKHKYEVKMNCIDDAVLDEAFVGGIEKHKIDKRGNLSYQVFESFEDLSQFFHGIGVEIVLKDEEEQVSVFPAIYCKSMYTFGKAEFVPYKDLYERNGWEPLHFNTRAMHNGKVFASVVINPHLFILRKIEALYNREQTSFYEVVETKSGCGKVTIIDGVEVMGLKGFVPGSFLNLSDFDNPFLRWGPDSHGILNNFSFVFTPTHVVEDGLHLVGAPNCITTDTQPPPGGDGTVNDGVTRVYHPASYTLDGRALAELPLKCGNLADSEVGLLEDTQVPIGHLLGRYIFHKTNNGWYVAQLGPLAIDGGKKKWKLATCGSRRKFDFSLLYNDGDVLNWKVPLSQQLRVGEEDAFPTTGDPCGSWVLLRETHILHPPAGFSIMEQARVDRFALLNGSYDGWEIMFRRDGLMGVSFYQGKLTRPEKKVRVHKSNQFFSYGVDWVVCDEEDPSLLRLEIEMYYTEGSEDFEEKARLIDQGEGQLGVWCFLEEMPDVSVL